MHQDELKQPSAHPGRSFDPGSQEIRERWGGRMEELYRERGIGARVGYGHHPALLVIDMAVAFNDPGYKVGADQTATVEAIAGLLASARAHAVRIFFFTTAYHPGGRDAGMFGKKIPALLELQLGDPGVEIDPRLAPREGEIVITKKYASAFFQTNLPSLLVAEGVDTIILTGCSTSGCVRASAVDGISHGYRVIVPEECVSDRAEGPHYANLFDINAKYGDVVTTAEVVEYFGELAAEVGHRRAAAATAR